MSSALHRAEHRTLRHTTTSLGGLAFLCVSALFCIPAAAATTNATSSQVTVTQQQQATHIANDKTPQNLAAGAKNPNADAQKNRLRTLVMGLTPRRGVDPTLANVLTDAVVGVYAEQKARAVLSRDDIAKLIDLESEKQALNCDEDSCLAEIGAAMDVDRIVHGTIDKVGNSYVIAMAEIDARSVETIARATQKIDADEGLAFDVATELAKKLLGTSNTSRSTGDPIKKPKGSDADKKKTNPSVNADVKTDPKDKDKKNNNVAENGTIDDTKKQNPVPDSKPDGKTGALQVAVDTIDAKVFVDGTEKGLAPVIVEKLPAGLHRVTVVRPDHGDLTFDATVFSDGITISTIVVDQLGDLSEGQRAMYADAQRQQRDNLWWKYTGGGVCLAGSACAGIIAGVAIGNGSVGLATNGCWTSVGLFLAGGAGIGWGIYDSVVPVPQPIPDGPRKHVVTVTPPEGQGAPITIQIIDTPAPMTSSFDETDGKSLPLALPMLH